jgi:prevent-host-death family protein
MELRTSSMLDISKDIQSLTAFRRNSGRLIKKLRKSKRPLVLTVRGRAQAVVQDAEAYQRFLDAAARSNVHEAIRQGLGDVAQGRTRPAREVFDDIRRRYDIPHKTVHVLTIRHGARDEFTEDRSDT